MLRKIIAFLFPLAIFGMILTACSNGTPMKTQNKEHSTFTEEKNISTKDVTLNIEDTLSIDFNNYVFNGFIGNDTLAFQEKDSKNINCYQPAKVGHVFRFKDFQQITVKILDFNRENGTVKLRLTSNSQN